ncbi:zinc metalloproteinase nas-13-like [Chrysoperla carnea]|uniref:zinc metalloproteinase nas-13-like n=1 Tax=Chrysoperla carnea TaxID=189513 RepID=UPI001D08C66A|nr:zinc metalloproteinase nas-13-like [Chrysoperla carnea]
MKLILSLLAIFYINSCLCFPTYFRHSFVKPLTESELKRLKEWTEDDQQNIWEISGQFEGDIILSPDQPLNGLLSEAKRWPNKTIPYEFDDNGSFSEEQKNFINETLKQYAKLTCITARPKEPSDRDYVYITARQAGCYSEVGRQGGPQQINLQPDEPGSGCLRGGTILHEFLHALGFYHQQSSFERDLYVNIVWDNVQEGKEHNFEKYGRDTITNFDVTYDYGSVLHYGPYAFSKNGKKTIKVLRPFASIGQRKGFSEEDVLKLNRMYGCDPDYSQEN